MYHIKSLTDFDKPVETNLDAIADIIQRDSQVKTLCQRVRSATNKDEKRAWKFKLPAFVLGEFNGKLKNSDFVRSAHLLFDIDHIDANRIGEVKAEIAKFAALAFISPSGEGIKFAIALQSPILPDSYRGNYEHYLKYFSDLLKVELDPQTKDMARKCYYSHDPDVIYNVNPQKFPVAKYATIQKVNNVDEIHVDEHELKAVCQYLSEYMLTYSEWTTCAMALQGRDDGFALFCILSKNKYYPDDTEQTFRQKYMQCNSAQNISIGSLFWIAMDHGYRRDKKYLRKGGSLYPFEVEKDGSYYRDAKDNYLWVFGFKEIEYLYDIREVKTKDGKIAGESLLDDVQELQTCLRIDDKEIIIPTASLTSGATLKKEICSQISLHFTHGKSDAYFTMLSEYLHRTKKGAEVKLVKGVGKILPNIWNWGNYVILNGNVYDYEPIIWTSGTSGYMLENHSNIMVHPQKGNIKQKLERLRYFFGEQLALALGWAVANVWFDEVMRDYGGFPILFLYGDSGKGKTKLGTMLLALFGVRNPESDKAFHNSLADMTHVAGGRLKNSIYCFPTFFDEYNQKHYHLLKSLYDGSGRVTGLKDMTNKVRRSDISGGTITAALNRPHEKEVLNRCIYFDAVRAVDDTKAPAFNKEFMVAGAHEELSALAINLAVKNLGAQYREEMATAHAYLMENCIKTNEAIGRITQNYAVAYAGYKVLVKHGVIKEWVSIDKWVEWANETVNQIKEADPVDAFLFICKTFAMSGAYTQYIKSEILIGKDNEEYVRLTIFLKYVLPEVQEYCRRRNVYPDLLGMTALDMAGKLRSSVAFVESKTERFTYEKYDNYGNIATRNTCVARAYVMDVPLDAEEKELTIEEIPF